MMSFAKRIMSRALGIEAKAAPSGSQKKSYPYKNNSANQNRSGTDIVETIWVGMKAEQLVQSLGPALTKQYQGNREIWTYLNLKGQGTQTAIALQNGVVVNWQDIRQNPAARFAAR